jgi:hypothetical protein
MLKEGEERANLTLLCLQKLFSAGCVQDSVGSVLGMH